MIKDIVSKISKHADKMLHFLVCYGLVVTFIMGGHWLVGVIIAVILSVSKELFDQYLYKVFSWGDIIADVIGICTALLIGMGSII